MRQRLWLISEVFHPDTDIATGNIATEIAMKFSEHYEVHVICGPKDYEVKSEKATTTVALPKNIIVHRWNHFNYNKNQSLKRLVRVVGISIGLFLKGFKIKRKEKVFVISNPAFITPLYAFLKWLKGFNYILLMHDVFPENLITGGYTNENRLLYKITRSVFLRSRKATDKIVVIGRDMKELLLQGFPAERSADIVIIPNWADVESISPQRYEENEIIKKLQLHQKITILFAGNHGVLQNLSSFLKIIENVVNPSVHFIFAGGGAEKPKLEQYAAAHKINNVSFLPAFPRSELNKMLNACHIGLVSLSDKLYGVGVPSKSYNILAAEKPILFLGNTETEIPMFVVDANVGWAFSYDNGTQITAFLNELTLQQLSIIVEKGKNGRREVTYNYSKGKVLNDLLEFVKRVD